MAVKTTRVRVCDWPECGVEVETKPYRVGLPPSRLLMFDLCVEHAGPLEAFRGLRRPRPGRLAEPREVKTVAQVSGRKRARKKPARKAG